MGHPEKGCIVPPEVSEFLLEEAAARADILCPNQLELDSFCGRRAQSLEDCVNMARSLLQRGPQVVVVKHLAYPGRAEDQFEMLLVTAEHSWLLRRPLLAFPRQPVGVGDLTSGLFLARVLLGDSWVQAFEFTAAAVHEVLLETQACASYELQLVRAQDRIAHRVCASRRNCWRFKWRRSSGPGSAFPAPGGSAGAAGPAGSGAFLHCFAAGAAAPPPGDGCRRPRPW